MMANPQGIIHPDLLDRLQPTFYPTSATITRKTLSSDGRGGQSESWATVATANCRYAPSGAQPNETINADTLQNVSLWTVAFASAPDVRDADRIVIGSRTFEVVKAMNHTVDAPLSVQVAEIV